MSMTFKMVHQISRYENFHPYENHTFSHHFHSESNNLIIDNTIVSRVGLQSYLQMKTNILECIRVMGKSPC